MLYIYICEDEEVQLNYIRDMIAGYVADKGIEAKIEAAKKDPEEILQGCGKIVSLLFSS